MADEIARLVVAVDLEDNASAGLAKLSSNVNGLARTSDVGGSAVDTMSKKMQKAGKSIKDVGEGIDTVTKPIQAAAVGAVAAGVMVSKAAMTYETAFTGVKKTVDGTPEELEAVSQGLRGMSKEIPVSAAELANLAAVGGQLGVQTPDILKFTKTMAAMGVATNLSGEEGAAALARLINVTGDSMDNVDRVGSSIVALGNNTATTEAEIAAMAVRMGKFGNTVGMDTAQVLGYSAALSSVGIEAQMGGSAIGRTWLDIETAVNSGGDALQAYAKYAGTSADEFKKQWSTDPSGAFNGLIKGLSATENLTGALSELGIENTQDQQAIMALANNYELLAKCMNLSGQAYKENTALTKEATAAYATTANQIQLTKNAVTEAGIKWGEILLPEVKSGAEWVAGLAEKFGNLDDSQKKAVISGAKTAVVLGASAKAVVGTVKGVGAFAEGVGKIKGAFSAGGAFAKAAPVLKGIASAASPAAIGIAGITAAVIAAKKASDAGYNSQYRWSKGLSEGNKKIAESLSKYKQLSSIQGEIKDLKLIIENPESSQEQVETAKTRLEEIKQMLSEEYNLVINSDNSNLEKTAEQVKKMSRNDLQSNINKQRNKLADLQEDFDNYPKKIAQATAKYQDSLTNQTKFSELKLQFSELKSEYKNGKLSASEYQKSVTDIAKAYGLSEQSQRNYKSAINEVNTAYDTATYNAEEYKKQIDNLNGSHDEFVAINTELANWGTELLKIAANEGDSEGTRQALDLMSESIRHAGLDLEGYAQAAALAMNGVDSLKTAWEQAENGNGQALDGIVKDYIKSMQTFGASAQDTAVGASLIKNGLTSIGEAAEKGKLDVVAKQATELARKFELIPEDKRIEISATGDISLIDDATNKVEQIEGKNITVSVNANGDISILDETTGKTQLLQGLGDVHISVNGEGNIEILDEAEQKIAEIDGESGEIIVNGEYPGAEEIQKAIEDQNTTENKSTELTANGSYPGKEDIAQALSDQNSLRNVDVTYTVTYKQIGTKPDISVKTNAKGTQNFSGGLAMVNDQKGIADPRELIVDSGRAFIPEGRNVILPLSKGAKVYTAAQTKAIMSGLGIPHYAQGKDNSDAFVSARDELTHYTRTHAVTTTQELEKWVELSEKFKDNEKDRWDIEEQIFSLTQKQTNELNEQSKAYIKTRTALNDWEDYGDSPLEAFGRIKDRNYQEMLAGRQTWEEYAKTVSDIGEDMYDSRISQSYNWLEHEKEYHNLSADDYIAGLQRMAEYTLEYYEQGLINQEKYRKSAQEIDEKYLDSVKEKNENIYLSWKKDADYWYKQREAYDDWEDYGDGKVKFYQRSIDKISEMYKAGFIGFEQFHDDTIEAQINMYQAQIDEVDAVLAAQQKYIDSVDEEYNKLIRKKEDVFDSENLAADIQEAQDKMSIYAGAVTQRGKETYKEASERLRELTHQKEIKELQAKQTEEVEALRADYTIAEDNKKQLMKALNASSIDISGLTESINQNVSGTQQLLKQIITAITNSARSISAGGNSYTDNRTVHIATGVNVAEVKRIIGNTYVSGLGSVMYNGTRFNL